MLLKPAGFMKAQAGASSLTVSQNGVVRDIATGDALPVTEDLTLGTTVSGRKIVVLALWGQTGGGGGLDVTCTYDPSGAATSVTVTEVFDVQNGNQDITAFHFDAANSGTYRISMDPTASGVDWQDVDYIVLEAEGVTTIDAPPVVTQNAPSVFDLSDTVNAGEYVVAGIIIGNRGTTGDFTWGGHLSASDEVVQRAGKGSRELAFAFKQATASGDPLAMSVEATGDSSFASVAGLVRIA